jgi:hypothetical protein
MMHYDVVCVGYFVSQITYYNYRLLSWTLDKHNKETSEGYSPKSEV